MMLTFGQYNVLVAARNGVTRHQLTAQTEFDELMVSYYMSGLLAHGLIVATTDEKPVRYQLTQTGAACLLDYERHNPELSITRRILLTIG